MFKYPYFSGQNVTITLYNNKTEFSTPLSKSYRCAKEQTFDLFGSNNTTGAIKLSHIQLEAFYEKRDGLFDAGLYPIRDMIIFVYILILCTNNIYSCIVLLIYHYFLGWGCISFLTGSWSYRTKAVTLLGWVFHVMYSICLCCQ